MRQRHTTPVKWGGDRSAGAATGVPPGGGQWFAGRFPEGPTAPQAAAWPHIAAGSDVLVASPTGTGKTLTGFLVAIDAAYRAAEAAATAEAERKPGGRTEPGGVAGSPGVLYVSPLRALAVDVHENLHVPLGEIRDVAARLGYADPELRVAIRTGDTPPAERAAMRKHAPDLLVTTPESLYLLLTAPASRAMLRGVHTVIVDEVHTLARDKRGSHLALSLERLDALVAEAGGHLQRIGLSATQRPLDVVARLLSGVHDDRPPTVIVDCGHARHLDVAIELPDSELEAVASGGQFGDILDRIAAHTREHRTTLIFVNTRKMAERVAHQLAERLAGEATGATGRRARRRRRTGGTAMTWTLRSWWRPTTAASRRPAGASSRLGCGRATCAPWWPPPRWSWASMSGRSSWSARSARPGPSAPSSSGWDGPTTSATGRRPAGSSR